MALTCLCSAPAQANEYDVWSCRGPDGEALSAAAWKVQTNDAEPGDVWMTDDCLTGGPVGLHVNDAGVPGGRKARIDLTFDLPRDGEIAGYTLNRAITAAAAFSGYSYAAAVREFQPGTYFDSGCASYLSIPSFDCSVLGSHTNPADPGNTIVRSGLSLNGLSTWAACLSSGCAAPVSAPSAELSLFSARVSIVDDDAPAITDVGGALTRPAPVTGLADLFVEAADTGAGIRSLSLSIDGLPAETIAVDPASTCVEPFEVPRPCPAQLGRIFTVDTDTLASGAHTSAGTVTDAAGNTTPFGPIPFTVADRNVDPGPDPDPGPEAPDNGVPAVEDPQLKLDDALVEHAPGKPVSVDGLLTTATGQPISGARLDVVSTSLGARSSVEIPLRPVTTDTAGRFSVPSNGLGARRVTVTFSPTLSGAVSRRVSATVRSRLSVSFKAKPRRIKLGKPVRFSGKILGGGPTVRGANTEIQAIADGRWQTVANVVAKKGGRFVWKYRFRHVERDAIFSFRALIRENPGWPWPTVKSKKLKVRIEVPGA